MNIYVANLNFDLKDEDLKNLFLPFGEVSSARIITDRMTSESRGFGFVEMVDDEAGRKAIAELNGAIVGGRTIKMNEAKPRTDAKPMPEAKFNEQRERNYNNSNSYNQTIY
jgi:RNA recognition motif-containing protein